MAAGIEAREDLHRTAKGALGEIQSQVQGRVHFHCGDPFSCNWNEANVIFLTVDFSDEAVSSAITDRIRHLPVGARVVTLSQPLPLPLPAGWLQTAQLPYRMSWGNVTSYTYRRQK